MADGIKIKITSDDSDVLKDLHKIESAAQKTFQRTSAAAKKTAGDIAALDQKMKELAANKRVELGAGMPWKPEELDAVVDKALQSDKAFQRMSASMDKLQSKWSGQSSAAREAKEAYDQATKSANEGAVAISRKASISEKAKKVFAALSSGLGIMKKKTDETRDASDRLTQKTIPLTKTILKLSNMLKLLLLRMIFRKAIEAVRQGFQDLAQYSTAFNGTMSQLSTAFLQARNSIAVAFAPVLQALTPIILTVTDAFINAMNVVSAFTASLFGNTMTFTRAKKALVDYAKSITDTSKKTKNSLAPFDDLNVLMDNSQDGVPDPSEMFEEVEIDESIKSITDKVKDMFTDWKKAAQPTIDAIKSLVSNLEPLKTFAAQGLTDFYNRFLEPVGRWVLGEGIPGLVTALRDGLSKVDLTRVNESLNRLWDALRPFAIKVGEGLAWLWENVLVPLGVWTISNLLPAFLDLLAAGLDALNAVIDALKPLALWLWEEFLKPIAEWTGEIIIRAINWLTEALQRFTDWARANPETVRTIAEIILGFLAGLWVYSTTKKIVVFIAELVTSFSSLAAGINIAAISSAAASIGFAALFAAIILIIQNWDKMNDMEKTIAILGAVAVAAASCAFAVGALQSAWSMGIAAVAIVAGIAAIGVAIYSANQRANAQLADLQAPAVNPQTSIPKFATGAVIPPNNEFAAILGDQKSGRNFEAPEGLLRQIVREESGESGDINVNIKFTGSLAQLGRLLKPVAEVENRRVGGNFVKGGAF